MSEQGNVFDNSVELPTLTEGQEQYEGTEDIATDEVSPVEEQGQDAPVETAEVDYRALYENTKKAYDNIRPAYTKATQELSRYKQPQAMTEEQPAQVQTPSLVQPEGQQDIQTVIRGLVQQAVAPLQQQQSELVMQSEVARFKAITPDFDTYAPQMYQVLEQMPELWNVGGIDTVLHTAYKLARVDAIEQQIPELVSRARNDAYATQVVKEINSTDKQRPNTQNQVVKSEADSIRESIVSSGKARGSLF